MCITKSINVIISVSRDSRGYDVNYDFIDSESGDTYGWFAYCENGKMKEAEDYEHVGSELAAWVPLMIDELKEMENEED